MSSDDRSLVVAVDCGTSSTKAIAIDLSGRIVASATAALGLATPRPGWVEQDPHEVEASADVALEDLSSQIDRARVAAVGVTNQRESLVLWERSTGRAIAPLLSWQDRRTSTMTKRLIDDGNGEFVREISGLPLDPMFSATKASWLLDEHDPQRKRSEAGELCLGTVDSWIAWHLTGRHVTEPGNASRTSLLDVSVCAWSPELLDLFGVPVECLPEIGSSARHDLGISGGVFAGVPLSGLIGDSHAALFAHQGWTSGTAKVTLGTGASVMATVDAALDHRGLCKTIAWQLPGYAPTLALEGNILSAGATLSWLANLLGATPEQLAIEAAAATGVAFVPAFDGLGAPWWNDSAVGLISGLSLSTGRSDLARAALDSVVMQVADVTDAFASAGAPLTTLIADGGMSANSLLMTQLADATELDVWVSGVPEASAIGAANLAGLGIGLWSVDDLERRDRDYNVVNPSADEFARGHRRRVWNDALHRAQCESTNGDRDG